MPIFSFYYLILLSELIMSCRFKTIQKREKRQKIDKNEINKEESDKDTRINM